MEIDLSEVAGNTRLKDEVLKSLFQSKLSAVEIDLETVAGYARLKEDVLKSLVSHSKVP